MVRIGATEGFHMRMLILAGNEHHDAFAAGEQSHHLEDSQPSRRCRHMVLTSSLDMLLSRRYPQSRFYAFM
eukprot:8386528-Pyramimonas_sp.AAC.1